MDRKQILLKLAEKELMVILAIVLLLGVIIGYSIAASRPTSTSIIPPESNILSAELGGEENIR